MEGQETLHQRLEILEQSGLIEKHTTEQTGKIIGLLYGKGHEPDMEKMETFITHIAMAMQRIQNSEYEQPLAKEVLEDLKTEAFYEEAKKLAQEIYGIVDIEFPQAERDYLIVHLCNLLS